MRDEIKKVIADTLGIDVADIEEEQALRENLGVEVHNLTDILENLKALKVDIPSENLSEVESVGDLLDLAEQYAQEDI